MLDYNCVYDVQFDESGITEPVTLTEAKDFCKIDISNDDNLIIALITAARQMCEAYTGVAFVQKDVTAVINNVNGNMFLPYGPINEIYQITDDEGNILTVDTDYTLRGNEFMRLEYPCWDNLTAEYSGGYVELPEILKTGLLNAIYYLYDNRSEGVEDVGPIAKMILKPFRRV
jgi:hypothetical protein